MAARHAPAERILEPELEERAARVQRVRLRAFFDQHDGRVALDRDEEPAGPRLGALGGDGVEQVTVGLAELTLVGLDQEDPGRRGQVQPEGRPLLDDQVLDELAAEQLVQEPAPQAVLDLERGSLAQEFERHEQGPVFER